MSNDILYLIVGASGSGKTYIIDRICKDFNMKQVSSRTTRKARYNGEIGHKFVTDEQADKEFSNSVAKTNYNGYRYYTTVEDLEESDFYVIDVQGVISFDYSKVNKKVKVLFIKSPWYVRLINMLKRKDKIKDVINRLLLDRKEFKGFKGDVNFKNSNDLYNYFDNKDFFNKFLLKPIKNMEE
jgi:guanylate kinase